MFNDIGSKLKNIAAVYTIGTIILCIIACLILLFSNIVLALIYGIVGSLIAWVTGCVIYGIGQAVENTDKLVKKLAPETLEPAQPVFQSAPKREPWTCVSCGTENLGHIPYCNSCGISREWSQERQKKTNL